MNRRALSPAVAVVLLIALWGFAGLLDQPLEGQHPMLTAFEEADAWLAGSGNPLDLGPALVRLVCQPETGSLRDSGGPRVRLARVVTDLPAPPPDDERERPRALRCFLDPSQGVADEPRARTRAAW